MTCCGQALEGDPDGGKTRVVTQNNGGPTYWVGRQANGGNFTPYWDTMGLYDWGGALSMARTLGGDANQVAVAGRKVLVGWLGYGGGKDTAMQSLGRDLSLSKDYELLQQFVPELKMLRVPGSHTRDEFDGDETDSDGRRVQQSVKVAGSPLAEVVAEFELSSDLIERDGGGAFGVTVLGGGATGKYTITLAATTKSATVSGKGIPRQTSLSGPLSVVGSKVRLHAIVDKGVIEVIYNNRTAIATNTKLESPNATEIALFVRPLRLPALVDSAALTSWWRAGRWRWGEGHAGDLGAEGSEQPEAAAVGPYRCE